MARSPRLPVRPDTHWLRLFFDKVKVRPSGCWEWMAAMWRGYGYFMGHRAHRVTYRWFVGAPDPALHLHHTCERKDCVNPAHLVELSVSDHRRHGHDWAKQGTCKRGHKLTPSNIGTRKLGPRRVRICLECLALQRARARDKKETARLIDRQVRHA